MIVAFKVKGNLKRAEILYFRSLISYVNGVYCVMYFPPKEVLEMFILA